jgi:hypothetical protein
MSIVGLEPCLCRALTTAWYTGIPDYTLNRPMSQHFDSQMPQDEDPWGYIWFCWRSSACPVNAWTASRPLSRLHRAIEAMMSSSPLSRMNHPRSVDFCCVIRRGFSSSPTLLGPFPGYILHIAGSRNENNIVQIDFASSWLLADGVACVARDRSRPCAFPRTRRGSQSCPSVRIRSAGLNWCGDVLRRPAYEVATQERTKREGQTHNNLNVDPGT